MLDPPRQVYIYREPRLQESIWLILAASSAVHIQLLSFSQPEYFGCRNENTLSRAMRSHILVVAVVMVSFHHKSFLSQPPTPKDYYYKASNPSKTSCSSGVILAKSDNSRDLVRRVKGSNTDDDDEDDSVRCGPDDKRRSTARCID